MLKVMRDYTKSATLNHEPCGMELVIDHINNDKSDNSVNNLQEITQKENFNKRIK